MTIAIVKKIYQFLHIVVEHFLDDLCLTYAASLTFTSLLSLVPLLTVSFTVVNLIPAFKGLQQQIQHFVFSNFVAGAAQAIDQYIQQFLVQATHLSITTTIFLFVTVILMIFNIEKALNAIWHVKRRRNSWHAALIYLAVLIFLPLLIGLGIVMTSYLRSIPFIAEHSQYFIFTRPFLNYAPFLLTFIAFTILFTAMPNCKVMLRYSATGSFVTTILFELAKQGFAFYIVHFPTYKLIYGALAAIPLFLVWVYYSWVITLFGAVVCHIMGEHKLLEKKYEHQSADQTT